ncbi:MAG: hypothetical protein NVSMB51_16780 [Solirubrobacteraceae bacterium]
MRELAAELAHVHAAAERTALARGAVSHVGPLDDTLALAREIAAAPRGAVREVKRRALLEAQASWLPLLAEEERALRSAMLGPD